MSLNVVVCDDDDERAADWADRINGVDADVQAKALTSDDFGAAVGALKERKAYAKLHGKLPSRADAAQVLDAADVLVLDSDLTPDADSAQGQQPSEMVQQHLVGELGGEVAHLARCYSSATALMVINQKWKRRSFDLTLLAFASEVAEVYVSESDLANPGLWSIPTKAGEFRPWTWPVLAELPPVLEHLCQSVGLESSVLHSLGLDDERVMSAFTARQWDALGVDDPEQMTFDTVANESNFGLRLKETVEEEQRLRVGVLGVRRWLERHVLPSQNVLLDAPHFLQRRPWCVADRGVISAWNVPAQWFVLPDETEQNGVSRPGLDPSPAAYAPTASRWLGRHVWLWPLALEDSRPGDQRVLPGDPVFCEDTSTFVDLDSAADFLSDLEGPSGERFVQQLGDVDYHPRRRLLA